MNFFGRRQTGPEELTAKENTPRMATLRERGIGKHAVWKTRAAYYAPDSPIAKLLRDRKSAEKPIHPAGLLVETFEVASATREGEFRKDVVESMRAMMPQSLGLSLQAPGAKAPEIMDAKPKRGL